MLPRFFAPLLMWTGPLQIQAAPWTATNEELEECKEEMVIDIFFEGSVAAAAGTRKNEEKKKKDCRSSSSKERTGAVRRVRSWTGEEG